MAAGFGLGTSWAILVLERSCEQLSPTARQGNKWRGRSAAALRCGVRRALTAVRQEERGRGELCALSAVSTGAGEPPTAPSSLVDSLVEFPVLR